MADETVYEIRALSLSEILDTSFRLVRDRFQLLFGFALLLYLPLMGGLAALTQLVDPSSGELLQLEQPQLVQLGVAGLVWLTLVSLVFPFTAVAVTGGAAEVYLGRPVGVGDAARLGLSKYVHWAWVVSVFFLYVLGAGVLFALALGTLVALAAPLDSFGALGVPLLILLLLVGIPAVIAGAFFFWGFGFILSTVSVLEPLSARESIARAWRLCAAARWRLLGVSGVVYLVALIPSSACQMLMDFMPLAGTLLSGVIQAAAYCYMVTAFVVFYFDIRCREEAFDLEHLASRVEGAEPGPSPPPPLVR